MCHFIFHYNFLAPINFCSFVPLETGMNTLQNIWFYLLKGLKSNYSGSDITYLKYEACFDFLSDHC